MIIPMQCEYYALEGLSDLVGTIRKVHANFNPEIKIMGILRVMYDSRITLAGFHALNYSMFNLAYGYARENMSAFVELQQAEFAAADKGYSAVEEDFYYIS